MKRIALVLLLLLLVTSGCVRRRLLVRSNPPGATVHVDNQPIGVTPCGVDFTYYGTREVRLSMPGFETLTVNQPIPTPWYEVPGVDFVSENLVPNRIEDIRTVSFNLMRQRMASAEEIVARAEQLRGQAAPTGAAPIGVTAEPAFQPLAPPLSQPTFEPSPTLAPLQPNGQPVAPQLTPQATPPSGPPGGFRY